MQQRIETENESHPADPSVEQIDLWMLADEDCRKCGGNGYIKVGRAFSAPALYFCACSGSGPIIQVFGDGQALVPSPDTGAWGTPT